MEVGELGEEGALAVLGLDMSVGEYAEQGLDRNLAAAVVLVEDGVVLAEEALVVEGEEIGCVGVGAVVGGVWLHGSGRGVVC